MKDTFTTRMAGVFFLLSMAAEFSAVGLAMSHGSGPATMNAMNWGVAEQMLTFQESWMRALFYLGVLSPSLSMLAWPGMYRVLAPGGSAAFYGVVVSTLAMLLGVIAESIRLSMVLTLPSGYLAAADTAKPAVLILGAFLGNLFQILAPTSFILLYAVAGYRRGLDGCWSSQPFWWDTLVGHFCYLITQRSGVLSSAWD
jgi:hypothetical protein